LIHLLLVVRWKDFYVLRGHDAGYRFFSRRCLHSKIKIRSALLVLSHALTQNLMLRFILKLPSDLLSGIRERLACEQ